MNGITPSSKTTSEILADKIREAILQGEFISGQPLKQDLLATRFGVSKIPVREALYVLQKEGLVTFLNNRGSIVSELSVADVEEIYTVRLALETLALERAISNLKTEDFIAAEGALKLIEASSNPSQWAKLNWQFHSALYQAAKMPRLLEMVAVLHNNVARYLLLYLNTLQQQEHSQEEHWQLLSACKEGKREQASGILRQHLFDARQCTIEFMSSQSMKGN